MHVTKIEQRDGLIQTDPNNHVSLPSGKIENWTDRTEFVRGDIIDFRAKLKMNKTVKKYRICLVQVGFINELLLDGKIRTLCSFFKTLKFSHNKYPGEKKEIFWEHIYDKLPNIRTDVDIEVPFLIPGDIPFSGKPFCTIVDIIYTIEVYTLSVIKLSPLTRYLFSPILRLKYTLVFLIFVKKQVSTFRS